ncbi:hypothetical protein [Pseudomonas mandelii]|uniref:hypothetical protein n=1 Tax=Pseudomonas mandelii TaxID=75612 RepID=UPI003D047BC1
MDVVYVPGLSWKQSPPPIPGTPNAIVLSQNNWDDFGFQSTLNAAIFVKGVRVLDFVLKVLTPANRYTATYLDSLIGQGGGAGYFQFQTQIIYLSLVI